MRILILFGQTLFYWLLVFVPIDSRLESFFLSGLPSGVRGGCWCLFTVNFSSIEATRLPWTLTKQLNLEDRYPTVPDPFFFRLL